MGISLQLDLRVAVQAALQLPDSRCADIVLAQPAKGLDHVPADGLFLSRDQQVLTAVVRRTEFRICNPDDVPVFDVRFELVGQREPLIVTVGETEGGTLTVCTY